MFIQLLTGDDPRSFRLEIQEFGSVLRVRSVTEMDAAVRDNELMKMLNRAIRPMLPAPIAPAAMLHKTMFVE